MNHNNHRRYNNNLEMNENNTEIFHDCESAKSSIWNRNILRHGFVIIPNIFLQCADKLHITDNEFRTLIIILSFQWSEDKLPFPSIQKLAKLTQKNPRTVRGIITRLEAKGFIKRVKRTGTSNLFQTDPIKRILNELADELGEKADWRESSSSLPVTNTLPPIGKKQPENNIKSVQINKYMYKKYENNYKYTRQEIDELISFFNNKFQNKFDSTPPRWSPKEQKIFESILSKYDGLENSKKITQEIFDDWESHSSGWKLAASNPTPGIILIYGINIVSQALHPNKHKIHKAAWK